ncbi:MAG: phenylalanine--tRNA ligase subunit beta [Proteobacteria bacterium]|nr:phenylalanine--tRNA ligase subunit beta [Pseudomonadota bacterium]
MKFSEHWLRTLCNPPRSTAELAETLTMGGLEVETVEPAAPPFTNVVVGRIAAIAPHPNADRLRVCTVDVGAATPLTIVCGAPNAAAGMTVPCAREGATLPGGLAIKRATMRGVESQGMLCSAQELGLADDASGLLALPSTLAPGTPLRDALALDDTLITLKITPNRADCLSLTGIARDTAALTGAPLTLPAWTDVAPASAATQRIVVDDPVACPRFCGRVIEGIDARAPTPDWMRTRLARSGIRSISAVVDITNYVMLEMGVPMHAYDARHVDGAIVVRWARAGETLTLLNGDVLKLDPELLLVCDEKKPLGLAGIMGGEHSGIADDTTTVFLEAAFWNPDAVQGRMRRLGFVSDAGYRFERGVDFMAQPRAIERATRLIVDLCGGRAGPLADVKAALPARDDVRVRLARINGLLGLALDAAAVGAIFERLGFAYRRDGDTFVVTPPSYRFDLAIEEDFVEEVARVHGFERIPATIGRHTAAMLPVPETVRTAPTLKGRLVARGWQEVVTFSFVDSARVALLDPGAEPLKLANPIAAQYDVMRPSLLPGLTAVLETAVARKVPRGAIFEWGRVFAAGPGGAHAQPLKVGGLAFGAALPERWCNPPRNVDFFDVKGELEALAAPRRVTTAPLTHPALHPGRAATVLVEGVAAGIVGELHPRIVRALDLPSAPVIFELDVGVLAPNPLPKAAAVSRQPVVRRDLAVVVDEAVPAQALLDALATVRAPFVGSIEIFDVYRGTGVPTGKKSVAILVLMQDTSRTLTDADSDAAVGALVGELASRFGATLR